MGKLFQKFIVFLAIFFACQLMAADFYSNINKSLFVFPEYIATGGSDITFNRKAESVGNPANISLATNSEIALAYTGFFGNILNTTVASYTSPISGDNGFGVSIAYLFVPDIEITTGMLGAGKNATDTIFDTTLIYNESSSEIYVNFAFGHTFKFSEKIHGSIGIALHSQRRRLIDYTGYGIGADAGLTVCFLKPGIRLSLLFDDITTNYLHWNSNYHDNGRPHSYFGFGWRKVFPYIYGQLSIMYKTPDLLSKGGVISIGGGGDDDKIPESYSISDHPEQLFTAASYGVEYLIHNTVALRMGLDDIKRINFGAGTNLFSQSLSFDFSYMVALSLAGTYSLSTTYRW